MSHTHGQSNVEVEDHEDPDGWATWAIGIGGTFLMITTVAIACGIYYRSATTEALDKNVNIRFEQRDMVRAAQHAVLVESAHWVSHQDGGKGAEKLVLPINEAMAIVAGDGK